MSSLFSRFKGNFPSQSTPPSVASAPHATYSDNNSSHSQSSQSSYLANPTVTVSPFDGSDKFFGLENFGSTCYCNSIIQCLFHSAPFRQHILNFPFPSQNSQSSCLLTPTNNAFVPPTTFSRSPTKSKPLISLISAASPRSKSTLTTLLSTSNTSIVSNANAAGTFTSVPSARTYDEKVSVDTRKKAALSNGPVINVDYDNSKLHGMPPSLFTCLKDIFIAISNHSSHTGVVSPHAFQQVLRRDFEIFRTPMHQDAHEFLSLLLNEVVENIKSCNVQDPSSQHCPSYTNINSSTESDNLMITPHKLDIDSSTNEAVFAAYDSLLPPSASSPVVSNKSALDASLNFKSDNSIPNIPSLTLPSIATENIPPENPTSPINSHNLSNNNPQPNHPSTVDSLLNIPSNFAKHLTSQSLQRPINAVSTAIDSSVDVNSKGFSTFSASWVHDLFGGLLSSETRCLNCDTVSSRDEPFFDLSVDTENHTSLTACLRKFSRKEMLCGRNKFHCDNCGGLQEAEKRMKIKRPPRVLALHLKRFKYSEEQQQLQKLFHRVVYPYQLRLFNTTHDAVDPDRLYELYAVVVHIGSGPYHGHYVSIVKTQACGWVLFDDELVEPVDKYFVLRFFGGEDSLASAYILFYREITEDALERESDADAEDEDDLDGEC